MKIFIAALFAVALLFGCAEDYEIEEEYGVENYADDMGGPKPLAVSYDDIVNEIERNCNKTIECQFKIIKACNHVGYRQLCRGAWTDVRIPFVRKNIYTGFCEYRSKILPASLGEHLYSYNLNHTFLLTESDLHFIQDVGACDLPQPSALIVSD
jgi:hypothetical protein